MEAVGIRVLIHYEWNLYKCKELQICFMEEALPNWLRTEQDGR
jgi:hypothetical protein